MSEVRTLAGRSSLVLTPDDSPVRTVRDATDLIGQALAEGASLIAIAVEALDPSFFDLRSGFAGEVLQKAANYHLKFAVIGDVSAHTAASNAFHDLVVESERSRSYFFVPDLDTLESRLAQLATPHG